MSRKTAIQVGVIVLMVGGSAFVLYSGFVSSEPPTTVSPAAEGNSFNVARLPLDNESPTPLVGSSEVVTNIDSTKILPLGSKFDLSLVKKYNADIRLNNYPKVDPITEVGPALNDLVKKSP